jgi:copper(I)-binding protein
LTRAWLLLALLLAGCVAAEGVSVAEARISEPFANTAALYFAATNHGAGPDRLVAVSSDAVEETRLHEMTIDGDGFATMIDADDFVVEPDGDLVLEPGSRHVMLLGTAAFEAGDVVEVELVWEHAGSMVIEAEVVPAGAGW